MTSIFIPISQITSLTDDVNITKDKCVKTTTSGSIKIVSASKSDKEL